MKQYAKAILGAVVAGLGAAATALLDNTISPVEWVTIASTALTALGAIWAVPNAPAKL